MLAAHRTVGKRIQDLSPERKQGASTEPGKEEKPLAERRRVTRTEKE